MPHALVRRRFEEFDQWKKGFESLAGVRAQAGCRSTALFRDRQNPHEVVVLFGFEDLERAVEQMSSDALRAAWQLAEMTDPGSKEILEALDVGDIGSVQLIEPDYLHGMSPSAVDSLIGDTSTWRGRIAPTAYCTHTPSPRCVVRRGHCLPH